MAPEKKRVHIFDTTLRDGEQPPEISLNVTRKLMLARQLSKLGVDVIEAGFPVTSKGDFEAVKAIADNIKGITVAALSRVIKEDIRTAWDAIKGAELPRIHTFISTSPIHMEKKLGKNPKEVLRMVSEGVTFAKSLCPDVEFSAEDATRSDLHFLAEAVKIAINCGANVINIPDTVGYILPDKFREILLNLVILVPELKEVTLSVHCHDDLGLAVANSLVPLSIPSISNVQIECTINGLGERAGNAALEEIAMILDIHNVNGYGTNLNTIEIKHTSEMVSELTGYLVQRNKAIVGDNAFAHSSGIHSDGMIKDQTTYEIIKPEKVGIKTGSKMVLGKTTGRKLVKQKLKELGYENVLENNDLFEEIFMVFKSLVDVKSSVTEDDLKAIVLELTLFQSKGYSLKFLRLSSNNDRELKGFARVDICHNGDGKVIAAESQGNGAIDAAIKAINYILEINASVKNFHVKQIGSGSDAQAEAWVTVVVNNKEASGRGISTDTNEASVKAYLNALNYIKLTNK